MVSIDAPVPIQRLPGDPEVFAPKKGVPLRFSGVDTGQCTSHRPAFHHDPALPRPADLPHPTTKIG